MREVDERREKRQTLEQRTRSIRLDSLDSAIDKSLVRSFWRSLQTRFDHLLLSTRQLGSSPTREGERDAHQAG